SGGGGRGVRPSVLERAPHVAGQAGARAPRPRALGVEAGPVRAHLEGAEHRVALRAVDLVVAARAGLQALACRLSVAQEPDGSAVVVAGPETARRAQPHLGVALAAERLGAVARRALGVTPEGVGLVPRHEARRMVPASRRAVVALDAE